MNAKSRLRRAPIRPRRRSSSRAIRGARAGAQLPRERGLLRGRKPGRRRRARGRAGGPEPRPPPGLPGSVCGVVYQGSTRPPAASSPSPATARSIASRTPTGWRRAYGIAEAALSGSVYAPVGWATHYHADYVVPYWASTLAKNAIVGAHIFYRWAGGWGQPAAFAEGYAGRSPTRPRCATPRSPRPHRLRRRAASPRPIKEIPGAEALKLARRCAATSASRSASTSSRARRRTRRARGLRQEVRGFGQPQMSLSGDAAAADSSRSASRRSHCDAAERRPALVGLMRFRLPDSHMLSSHPPN